MESDQESVATTVSEPATRHIVQLERQADEWKERIAQIDIILAGKTRETNATQGALSELKAQKQRVRQLVAKVDAKIEETVRQGVALVSDPIESGSLSMSKR
jgi:chromosome segregation ATPase